MNINYNIKEKYQEKQFFLRNIKIDTNVFNQFL